VLIVEIWIKKFLTFRL